MKSILRQVLVGLVASVVTVELVSFFRAHPVGFGHARPEVVRADEVETRLVRPYPDPDPAIPSRPAVHLAYLDRPFPKLAAAKITLGEFAKALQDAAGVEVRVNWRALDAIGIDSKTTFALDLPETRVHLALETGLLAAGDGTVVLGFRAEPGRLMISSDGEIGGTRVIRIYDVRELMERATRVSRNLEAITAATTQPTTTEKVYPRGEDDMARDLIGSMMKAVAVDSWRGVGGTFEDPSYFAGQLIIVQTPENHEKLLAYLRLLRQSTPGTALVPAR